MAAALPEGFDPATFEYVGPCSRCGTGHDGHPPETLGGAIRCVEAQARQLGDEDTADRAALVRTWAATAQANALGLPVPGVD